MNRFIITLILLLGGSFAVNNTGEEDNYYASLNAENEVIIAVLGDEILLAESRLQPHDTGHLHDYIARLTHRLVEVKKGEEE